MQNRKVGVDLEVTGKSGDECDQSIWYEILRKLRKILVIQFLD